MTETTNWKNEVNELMALELDNVVELILDGDLSEENGKSIKNAIKVASVFFNKFFDRAIKHYNGNEERACDDFMLEKALEQFEFFVINMYGDEALGFKEADDKTKKELRVILGRLQGF